MDSQNKTIEIPEDISKENKNYIFGKRIGSFLSNVNPKMQFEASMMAMVFMIIGGLITDVYIVIWSSFNLFFKISIVVNSLFALLFLSSMLVTTFQQYQSYLSINDIQSILKDASVIYNSELKGGNENG